MPDTFASPIGLPPPPPFPEGCDDFAANAPVAIDEARLIAGAYDAAVLASLNRHEVEQEAKYGRSSRAQVRRARAAELAAWRREVRYDVARQRGRTRRPATRSARSIACRTRRTTKAKTSSSSSDGEPPSRRRASLAIGRAS
jgi:hypothetical protein